MALRIASIAAAAVGIAAFASSLTAGAQEANGVTVDVASVDGSRFPSLSAVVNVLDAKGRPVAGLDTASFSATIDGRPAIVEGLQSVVDSQVSLSVVLAVDASGSMAGAPLTAAQSAAAEFVNGLSPQDSVAVLAFSGTVTAVQEPTPDKAAAIGALQNLTAAGDTALFEATSRAAAKALESSSPRRVVILLSDGVDYGGKSSVTRDDSIAQARITGVPIYTIALGAEVDKAYLNELAQATGARFLEAPSPEGLSQLYAGIAAVLRGQYVVAMQSPAVDVAASHELELSVTVGGTTAVASKSVAFAASGQSSQVTLEGIRSGEDVKSAVTVTARVSGGAPTEVRFLVDGTAVATATAPPYQAALDPAALANGNHTLRVEARDATGILGSSEIGFAVPAAAAGGTSKVPLFAALLAVMAATVVIYVLRRRRPRVKRQVVEVRLKPWSNNTPVAGSVSLVDEEPVPPPAPEPVERPGGKLIIVDGPDAGREYPVGMSPLSIGSASWCDITFPDPDERIGPEEARAWVHQDKLIFHKLTRLSLLASDGAVGGWLVLENGDEVNVGHFRLRFISLAHTAAEQDVLNRAVNEAVQHLAGRASGGGVASRLWPVHDLPPQAPQAEEMGPQLAPFEIVPVDNPPVEAPESREENPEPARPRLWPVDDPPVDLAESEDVANQPDPFELSPFDDSSGELHGREEDSDHPAAASV